MTTIFLDPGLGRVSAGGTLSGGQACIVGRDQGAPSEPSTAGLHNASLRPTALATVDACAAKGGSCAARRLPGTFVKDKASVRLDAEASAAGGRFQGSPRAFTAPVGRSLKGSRRSAKCGC